MFASERQNVIKAVDYVRQSPLIGAKIPVHGLLIDIQSGKLEWVVNGYETLATAVSSVSSSARIRDEGDMVASLPKFNIGDMNFPDIKIGDAHSKPVPVEPVAPRLADLPSQLEHHHPHPHTTTPSTAVTPVTPVKEKPARIRIDKSAMYKILGEDRKVYGPATAAEVERWIEEGRIDLRTLVQKLGYHEWKQLEAYLEKQLPSDIPIPPALNTAMKVIKEIKKKTRR
jgi:hypothetical protein